MASDTFPPYRATIEGVPVVVYSLEDDKEIIICMEERQYLYSEIDACEQSVDSLMFVMSLYEDALSMNQAILNSKQRQLDAAFWQIDILEEQVTIGNELNRSLQNDYTKLQSKLNKRRKRNTILFTVGGIVLTGLLAGIIVKSVL